jgi:hypothetical protein
MVHFYYSYLDNHKGEFLVVVLIFVPLKVTCNKLYIEQLIVANYIFTTFPRIGYVSDVGIGIFLLL